MICYAIIPGRGRWQVIQDGISPRIADQVKVVIFIDDEHNHADSIANMANTSKNRLSAVGAAKVEK